MQEDIRLLYIDLFCGAGGTSTGVENAVLDGKKTTTPTPSHLTAPIIPTRSTTQQTYAPSSSAP